VSPDRWIALGVVARPHGVRGEVRIHLYNAASDVVLALREIDLEGHGRFRVAAARRDREAVLLRLEGCSTRDRADELRGARIGVPRSALPSTGQILEQITNKAIDAAEHDRGYPERVKQTIY